MVLISGGIGFAAAQAFLKANVHGLLLVDQTQDALDRALDLLSAEEKARCHSFVADVSSEESNYAERALQLWGHLDIAVLNAGVGNEPTSLLETDVKIWDRMMRINGRGGACRLT
jgi:NAD(P)-dependent dehydrogenase (short-subunit alcohol dehydrogenase family)